MSLLYNFIIFIGLIIFSTAIMMLPQLWLKDNFHYFPLFGVIQLFLKYGIFLPKMYFYSTILGLVSGTVTFSWFFNINPEGKGIYGKAKWAGLFDILKSKRISFKGGLILGRKYGKFIFTNDKENLSMIVFAPTRTGKTSGFIISSLFTSRNSMVIHDPKGEIWEKTKDQRSKFSNILKFEPASFDSNCVFNVFCKTMLPDDKRFLKEYIKNACEIIVPTPLNDTGNTIFFNDRGKQLINVLASYLIYKNGETSLPEIRKHFLSKDSYQVFWDIYNEDDLPDHIKENCRDVLNNSTSPEQWSGVISVAGKALGLYESDTVIKATKGKCDFSGELLRKSSLPLTVYIIIPDEDRIRLAPLVSLIFERISSNLMSSKPEPSDHKITFIIDEFPRLGKIIPLIELPSLSGGYGLNSIFIAQNIRQLYHIYGKDLSHVLASNCEYKIILKQNDLETARELSQMIGKTTVKKISKSIGSRNTINESKEGVDLVTPQDIMSLNRKKCIILFDEYRKPLKARIPFWYKNKRLVTWLD
ncbi:MAG: type IV secretory system conjugative DNA transfer family protein [Sphingobacteriia bacterium]|nr:type IV secretory system conjugative DNA transfer family protein [Sphingobacteriia bacterium]